jgi:hypothetical protein
MKKFFLSLIILISFTFAANTQTTMEQKSFLARVFPKDMPDHVLKNTEVVPVTKKYAKKHNDVYLHDDLKGNTYPGYIREGDTLLVFNSQPYFSIGQNVFMVPVDEQKTAKIKTPKTAEERQRSQQGAGEIINGIIKTGVNVLRNKSYSNTNGGVPF